MATESDKDSPEDKTMIQTNAPSARRDGVQPDAQVNDAIGMALNSHYRELTEAPLPYRFLVLLAELEAKDARHEK
jgi:hypothetical protein